MRYAGDGCGEYDNSLVERGVCEIGQHRDRWSTVEQHRRFDGSAQIMVDRPRSCRRRLGVLVATTCTASRARRTRWSCEALGTCRTYRTGPTLGALRDPQIDELQRERAGD